MESEDTQTTENAKDRRKRLAKQACIVCLASLGHLAIGTNITFPSVAVSDLENHNTTITDQELTLSDTEKDMMGSLVSLGSLPGAWLAGVLMAVIGRRFSMIISGSICFVSWLGVALLPTPAGVLVARTISGIASGGMSVAGNTYAVEMADLEIRGFMALIPTLGLLLGQVLTVVIGYVARYYVVALICSAIPLCYCLAMALLPESPAFLVVKGREEQARRVLLKLRGSHADLDLEIKSFYKMNTEANEKGSMWRSLLQPEALKAVSVVCILFIFQAFSGYFVFTVNASRFFKDAGSSVDEDLAAIIVMIVQFIITIFACFLVDKIGRRKSLFISFGAMVPFLVIMAIYVGLTEDVDSGSKSSLLHPLGWRHLGMGAGTDDLTSVRTDEGESLPYGWIPLVSMMLYLAASCFGVNPVPYILANEYFHTLIRSQASSVCISGSTIGSFVALQLYTPMQEGLTLPGLYSFYALVCLFGIPFTYFCIRETGGKQIG